LCRREGIAESLYYKWSKEFLEAGKRQLSGDTARQATAPEVKELRSEALSLKECVAGCCQTNRLKHQRPWEREFYEAIIEGGKKSCQKHEQRHAPCMDPNKDDGGAKSCFRAVKWFQKEH